MNSMVTSSFRVLKALGSSATENAKGTIVAEELVTLVTLHCSHCTDLVLILIAVHSDSFLLNFCSTFIVLLQSTLEIQQLDIDITSRLAGRIATEYFERQLLVYEVIS